MEYIKKHYEKVVLFVVLLAVAVSAFMLTNEVGTIRTTLDEQLRSAIGGKQKGLRPVDLTNSTIALARIAGAYRVNLAGEHKAFNPAAWVKSGDTFKRLPDKIVPLTVARIVPLNLVVTFTSVVGTIENPRYQFTIVKEHEKQIQKRKSITTSLNEGTKNDLFLLREIRGSKESPSEVVIEMLSGGEIVELAKDKPHAKTSGYAADLKSDGVSRDFLNRRQDDVINVNSTNYKIVSINPAEVILETPNKTRIQLRPVASP